jgi:hypothetical protein
MANWCNLRLSAIGPEQELERFRHDAGARQGRIDTRRSTVFLPEMEIGEGGDLEADPPERFGRRFRRAEYRFQGRNDDHKDHFRGVSARYPALAFVLTYSDPNDDSHGSYLLLAGRERHWPIPQRLAREVMRKHYRRWKLVDARGRLDYDADDSDMAEWDAFFEYMDLASSHWDARVLAWLRERHPARSGRRGGEARKRRG